MNIKYDLEERTLIFSKEIIKFLKNQKVTILNKNVIYQLLRSSTSVGANYREANGAISKKDFKNKIHICKKEIQETKYWLELMGELIKEKEKEELKKLFQEAHELTLIFNKIAGKLK